jgi:hypothetical protein
MQIAQVYLIFSLCLVIFKPDMKEGPDGADFSGTPWNEWVCLKLCQAFGLEADEAEVLIFDGKPVIAAERFDRLWKEGGYTVFLKRICVRHQEFLHHENTRLMEAPESSRFSRY